LVSVLVSHSHPVSVTRQASQSVLRLGLACRLAAAQSVRQGSVTVADTTVLPSVQAYRLARLRLLWVKALVWRLLWVKALRRPPLLWVLGSLLAMAATRRCRWV
jgi:hypothetical protein